MSSSPFAAHSPARSSASFLVGNRRASEIAAVVSFGSAEAIRPGEGGVPIFDREKCVHCGACLWSCSVRVDGTDEVNLQLRAGTGGLHSAEN